MREIKFRAKSLDGIWFTWHLLDPIDIATLGIDPKTLGQFTGLTDKNGKEIYEGDIVAYIYNSSPQEERIGAIEWSEENCAWLFHKMLIEPTPRRTMCVIGNIYENPDLINNHKE